VRSRISLLIIIGYWLLGTSFSYAQEYPAINIGIDEGTPSNTIYDLFQDSKGYVWVGTENGLARFNGKRFKIFPSKNLKSLAVSSIQEDVNGTIWMINFSGQVLYLKGDTLRALEQWDKLDFSSFPGLNVAGDKVYISQTEEVLYVYSIPEDTLLMIDSIADAKTEYISINGSPEVWKRLGKQSFISLISESKFSFWIPKPINTFPTVVRIKNKWLISERYGTEKNLFILDSLGNVSDLTPFYGDKIRNMRSLEKLSDTSAGFIGPEGLIIIDSTQNAKRVLAGKNIGSITPTKEGGLIAGTLDLGIYMIPSLDARIHHTIAGKGYYRILHDKMNKRVIIGDLGGNIHFYDLSGNYQESYFSDAGGEVQSMYIDEASNRLLVQEQHFLTFDLEKKITNPTSISGIQTAKDMVKIDSLYYFATSNGVISADLESIFESRLMGIRTTSVERLSKYELIIGSQNGIKVYNLNTKKFNDELYSFQLEIKDMTACVKTDDQLYLGTETNGLYIYKDDSLRLHLNIENGLISNRIYAIEVRERWIAVGTDKGVSIIDKKNYSINNLDQEDGLKSIEVTDLCIVNDQLWITNLLGLQTFKLPIKKNNQQPYLEIDQLFVNNHPIPAEGSLSLPHDFQELVITFDVANNIHAFGKTKIYYRITSAYTSDKWNQTTLSDPTARYLSLPSGTFEIEAYAENNDGIRSNILKYPITVETPFWKEVWFLATVFILLISVIGIGIYRYFRNENNKKQEQLLKNNRLQHLRIARLTSIRAQMNPHFIFNTLSLAQGLVLQGESKLAGEIIQDFSKLMRKVLDLSSKEFVTLEAELEILHNYLTIEKRRLEGELDYTITIDEKIEPEFIKIPSLLTQPFVENAIRHGLMHKKSDRLLNIDFNQEDSCLVIKIKDNGIGREAAGKLRKPEHKSSFAINAYQKRIDLINEMNTRKIKLTLVDLKTENDRPKGTLVTIKIPLEV